MPAQNRIWLLALLLVVAAFVATSLLASTGNLHAIHAALHAIPFGDKFGHIGWAWLLSFVACRFAHTRKIRPVFGASFVLALLVVDECAQAFAPNRFFDLGDLLANGLGVAFGFASAALRRS